MKTAAVIIPTIGAPAVRQAIESCLASHEGDINVVAVIDGENHRATFDRHTEGLRDPRLQIVTLPENVGADGFYGHRIYAAFSHLANARHILFLDQDNSFAPEHIGQVTGLVEQNKLEWGYALRRTLTPDGSFFANDDCESLGRWPSCDDYHLVDTSCYCLTQGTAIRMASAWHGGWGQDRVVTKILLQHFPRNACTGHYTVNYRLQTERQQNFIRKGNDLMLARYPAGFPWSQPG